ncbi:MAG: LysM peptidoglycan-binding domain-containing protein [Candidatus Cryptobacteroides sp.]
MDRRLKSAIYPAILFIAAAFLSATAAYAQEYSNPVVKVSNEKVRAGNKVYYSHIVEERQTLYSISKAYGVAIDDIYSANPALKLETEGLKKGQILLIPIQENAGEARPAAEEKASEAVTAETPEEAAPARQSVQADKGYTFHKVKWYEDLESIAQKYKVSKRSIMNINNLSSEKLERKQMLKIPKDALAWEYEIPAPASRETGGMEESSGKEIQEESAEVENTEAEESGEESGFFFPSRKSNEVNITVALPFNARKGGNSQMMDFYSGALMAARDLGRKDYKINLNVIDVASEPFSGPQFEKSDYIIGPVSNSDIIKMVSACDSKTWIVSPLDPKAETIADTVQNVIQTPTSVGTQIHDMIDWMKEDFRRGDKLLLIKPKEEARSVYGSSVLKAVEASGVPYTTLSFNVLEGRDIMDAMTNVMTAEGSVRIIIASDNKPFVMEAVRNIFLVSSSNKIDVKLYGTARLRSFEGSDGIDVAQLHAVNTHITGAYYIDYDSKDVMDFIYEYRAVFNAEPSLSAFQGYDVLSFFATAARENGRRIKDCGKIAGLQSDLDLVKKPEGGYVNKAVRRVVYQPDYTIRIVK